MTFEQLKTLNVDDTETVRKDFEIVKDGDFGLLPPIESTQFAHQVFATMMTQLFKYG